MLRGIKTLFHGVVGFGAVILAYQLVFAPYLGWWLSDVDAAGVVLLALAYAVIAALTEVVFKVERSPWRFASVRDAFMLLRSTVVTALALLLVMFVLNRAELLPRSVLLLAWLIQLCTLAGIRLVRRAVYEGAMTPMLDAIGFGDGSSLKLETVLVVGDVDKADLALRDLARDPHKAYRPVGVVTPSAVDKGKLIRNVPVAGVLADWDGLLAAYARAERRPDAILFLSDPVELLTADQLGAVSAAGTKLLRLPRVIELGDPESTELRRVQEISIEELLSRPPVKLNLDHLRQFIGGKRVLVTGAGGSIGSEICRQAAAFGCAHLAMLDHSEYSLFEIDREIGNEHPRLSRRDILCNVRDGGRTAQWFQAERPEVIFHAAALKHVPLVESHPDQGFLTNVVGTLNVTEAAKDCGASDMVMISTDKAVAPSNVMGATKRLAESVVRHARKDSATRFTVVRFGNVLGSAGSVVPIFKDQISRGGPVTVTHRDVERYFMTIPEAVQLVIHAAATRADKAPDAPDLGIHVLDMGQPVRVHDLAERMIALSGKVPGRDIQIDIIGLRPGEKLTEELVDETEQVVLERQGVIEVADRRPGGGLTRRDIQALQRVAEAGDRDRVSRSIYELLDKVRLGSDI